MNSLKHSKFSIEALMEQKLQKDSLLQPPPVPDYTLLRTGIPNLMPAPTTNNLVANQLLYNMAVTSLHENFLESLRSGAMLYNQNHPVYAGALPTSLPGFVTHQHPNTLRSAKMDLLQEREKQSWLLAAQTNKHRLHSHILLQSALDYSNGMSLQKPKRIRTAFSPDQLVQLEASFQNNQYVVGQERRDLACELGLTETQVKVWFQNRRTKQKRGKGDDDGIIVIHS